MPFGQTYENNRAGGSSEVRESPYLRIKSGERIIRILDDDAVGFWQYFIDVNVGGKITGRSIIVGGSNNPIKRYMDSLEEGHPKYRRPSRRFLMNVYDRSPVIRVDGQTYYADDRGNFPPQTNVKDKDGFPLISEPNNRIMLLEFGPSLMEDFMTLHKRIRNPETGTAMSIQEFDLRIMAKGTGRDMKKTPIPGTDRDSTKPLPEAVADGPRYDLASCTRPVPDEAQERLLAGEDYSTIIRSLGWEPIKPLW
jgi:hypothetical protein